MKYPHCPSLILIPTTTPYNLRYSYQNQLNLQCMYMTSNGRKKHRRSVSLSYGRLTYVKRPTGRQSSKKTRSAITLYHQLQKARAQALQDGDEDKATVLLNKIDSCGGLASYQSASLVGQSKERGGDTSKVLVEWVREVLQRDGVNITDSSFAIGDGTLRMLEIGALSPKNACAQSKLFEMTRIDLRSMHSSIKQQDFMARPLPAGEGTENDDERFDILSLSLVLNCVPDPCRRGEMLRRTCMFLRQKSLSDQSNEERSMLFPSLFLVLPAPCVKNSRYVSEERLRLIMESLGYSLLRRKITAKLVYYLWKYDASKSKRGTFGKMEVHPGRVRNNFSIVLQG